MKFNGRDILESSKRLMEYYQDGSAIYSKSFKFKQFTTSNVLINYSAHIDPSAQVYFIYFTVLSFPFRLALM